MVVGTVLRFPKTAEQFVFVIAVGAPNVHITKSWLMHDCLEEG